jgi:selenocysteine lyase/cysteine desulfurase
LVAKRNLFNNPVPNGCGGGTVFFVTKTGHRYLKNDEFREEGGTPAIIESIRAGMIFQLKSAIGTDVILQKETEYVQKTIHFFQNIPNVHLLGSLSVERLAIFSFIIEHEESGLYLHSNFVSALLNDLFGIQTRSGCACAGPYAQYLLGIDPLLANSYDEALIQDERLESRRMTHETTIAEILRPGFTRFNLTFFWDESRVDFVLNAIKFVAQHGWKFLPQYIFNLETGEWRHHNFQV